MTSKHVNYLLILVAAVVWVIISLKIINHFRSKEVAIPDKNQKGNKEVIIPPKEIEILALNYPDPFFENPINIKVKTQRKPKKEVLKQKKTNTLPKLNIAYLGMLKRGNEDYAILRLDNKELLLRQGAANKSILIKDLARDSVLCEIQGQKIVVHRKKL